MFASRTSLGALTSLASTPAGDAAATKVRRTIEREGVPIDRLRPCAEEGRDGTRLPGCLKVYVPMPAAPWGIVFQSVVDDHGALLMALAFGPRHPDTKAPEVYPLAHARLHAV